MKNRNLIAAIVVSMMIGCNAQQLQTREVTSFNRIQATGGVNLVYLDSDTLSLSLKGREKDIGKIETTVENAILQIAPIKGLSDPVTIYIKSKNLSGVELSGAADFKSLNTVKTNEMELNVSGSASLKMDLDAAKIHCQQSGASNLVLKGKSNELLAEVTGASTLKAYQLLTKTARVTATGASTAKVYASDLLRANATGASDVKVKGDPKEVSAEAGGAASITRIKEVDGRDVKSDADTTSYNFKNKKLMVISGGKCKDGDCDGTDSKGNFRHWAGFSMGVNGYLGAGGNIGMKSPYQFMDLNYGRSFNFQFNIIERQFNLIQNYMKVVTGFGFDWHLYEFSNRTNLNPDTGYTWGIVDKEGSEKYLKNKLRCTYLQVPLLLEFNTSNNSEKSVHLAIGIVGQYLIASRTKQELEQDGYEYRRVKKDSYNLTPFAAKAHINIGYRGFTVFAEYGLSSLFQPGKGPELFPFGAGLRLVPFS